MTNPITVRDAVSAHIGFAQCGSIKDDSTRWNIVKNKRLLKPIYDQYEEHRTDLVKELSPEKLDVSKESTQVQKEFDERTKAILNKTCDTQGMLTIEKAHLNSITDPNVIDLIFPFISDPS